MGKDLGSDSENVAHKSRRAFKKAEHEIFIESFGVKIRIVTTRREGLDAVKKLLRNALGGRYRIIEKTDAEFTFRLNWNKDGRDSLFKNGEKIFTRLPRSEILETLESRLRITIAEYAVGKVFIHAGVVCWKGFALVLPSNSFRGKTTLVAELVRRGAVYYSDEYAVLDERGFVHPFPKTLSVRGIIDKYKQVEMPVEAFGGKAGTKEIPVGMFLLTEYKENARWKPKILSQGQGIMEILPHTVPVRYKPEFTLKVLNEAANRAIIAKSFRDDVSKSVDKILGFFESKITVV